MNTQVATIVSAMTFVTQNLLAIGMGDHTIHIWSLHQTYGDIIILRGHSDVISTLVTLPDSRLLSGSWDGSILIWDLKTRTSMTINTGGPVIGLICVSRDTDLSVLSWHPNCMHVW